MNEQKDVSYHLKILGGEEYQKARALLAELLEQAGCELIKTQAGEPAGLEDEIRQQRFLDKLEGLGRTGSWKMDFLDGSSYWSPEARRIFGVTEDTACSHDVRISKVHPEDREQVTQNWMNALEGKVFSSEHRILVNDRVRWLREKAEIQLDDNGNAVSALGFTQDITEQRVARDDLESALAQFRTLAEASPTAIYRADCDGNCTYVNPRWLEMAGMRFEEAMGKGWEAAIHPDDRQQMLLDWQEFVKRNDEQWKHEYRFLNRSGEVTTVLGTESPVRDREGQVVGYIGSNLDISERKRWEERIADQARFTEEDRNPIVRVSVDGVVLYANPAAEPLLGCFEAEAGHKMPPEKFSELSRIFEAAEPATISKECEGCLYELSVVPVPERGYVNLYGRDITAQARAEAALADAHALAIKQARLSALGEMASGIAHDFNNALMPILGFTDLLLAKPEQYMKDRDEMVSLLRHVLEAAEDARSIVQRLRMVHRDDADEEKRNVSLDEIISSSINLTSPRWKEQKSAEGCAVAVNTNLRGAARQINGNASELREMMMNLIMNAVDAMPQGGRIDISTTPLPDYIQLQVTDDGVGMSEEAMAKCLEPFYTTKGEDGSGLGLSMVNGIVERHNGILEISSREGKGTTVSVMFPYAIGQARR